MIFLCTPTTFSKSNTNLPNDYSDFCNISFYLLERNVPFSHARQPKWTDIQLHEHNNYRVHNQQS